MGLQEPSARVAPDYSSSDGMDALKILQAGKLNLDKWQSDILCDWLGRNTAGRWAATTCGGSVPRQNGKSLLVQARAAAGMILFNENVIYTAHLQKTATETFEELRDFFQRPPANRYVDEIKSAIGREQIKLTSGARIKFIARTRNSGRGQHGDLLIIDEAQEIDSTARDALLPAISASLNPQTIYAGTPPDPSVASTVFRDIRDRALNGETRQIAWFEFSVSEIGDIKDRRRWAAANPALGRRILENTIEGELEQMDPDSFARERLGWWSPRPGAKEIDHAIDLDAWALCKSSEKKPTGGKTAYGVKFSVDGAVVALCAAVIPENGSARISLIDLKATTHGTRWLSEWLIQRYMKASCVVIDGRNGVDLLIDRISDTWKMKGSIIRPTAANVVAAASLLTDKVNDQTLTWYSGQPLMDESAKKAEKRPIAGGWGFGGEDSAIIEAASLALWGAATCKRNPTKRMRIG